MIKIIFFGDDQYGEIVRQRLAKEPNISVTKYIPGDLPHDNELGVVASYGEILKPDLIQAFEPTGILCLHPSLLPQYRGATPAPHAIALGDQETGITLFRLTSKVDEGDIITQAVEPIEPEDDTPTLLNRLFSKGSDLLINWLTNSVSPEKLKSSMPEKLLFTRRFSRETGFVEWPVVQKMLVNQPIAAGDTKNQLLNLRLAKEFASSPIIHNSNPIIHDFVRALSPWPGVWTIAPTVKGDLRISIESVLPAITIKIAGKNNPISWEDFTKYYLG